MVLTGAEPVRWDRKENLHPPALLSLEKVTPDPCSSSICPQLVSQTPLVWPKCFSTCCCFFAGTRSKWICMWVLQKQSLVSPQFSSFPIICPTGSQSQVLRGLFFLNSCPPDWGVQHRAQTSYSLGWPSVIEISPFLVSHCPGVLSSEWAA